ncbi:MAG: HesA/MoeB/ThiF family protein [Cellvibrionaceae bacterium]|nr:HesA/MoeB/ThiF family protein [Cellvibrionaceae bacterium]
MTELPLTADEGLRYMRHVQLPQVGLKGQQRLRQARVLIVGAGGLGSPVAFYLAAAGVGHITLVDADRVDVSNLQRQILFTTDDIAQSKATSAQQRLLALNPNITVEAVTEAIAIDNAAALITPADLIIDCTDNFAARYLINDTCVRLQKPWLFASIYQFSGQCALFTPTSACFRCLFPEPPQHTGDCNSAGVLGVLPGLLGTHQANEALKYLLGLPCPLENTLLMIEAQDLTYQKIQLRKSPECRVCGDQQQPVNPADYDLPQPSQAMCDTAVAAVDISPDQFRQQKNSATVLLLDVRSAEEHQAFNLGGKHIPLEQLPDQLSNLLSDADASKKILCYCQTGSRSKQAAKLLITRGFQSQSLQGGLTQFIASSRTVV